MTPSVKGVFTDRRSCLPCISALIGPRRWHTVLVKARSPAIMTKTRDHQLKVKFTKKKITIARWNCGLFPFAVLANSVNCETQRMSPWISLTLAFHALSDSSEKTRKFKLAIRHVSSTKWTLVSERRERTSCLTR
jgi:hypothetical protein